MELELMANNKGNITYDDYITIYDEISNAGLSNHKYIDSRNKEEYKKWRYCICTLYLIWIIIL
jgi:hypothetical protein